MSLITVALLGSIPSPSSNRFEVGPLAFNYYGMCIAVGVLVAVWMGQRRWKARGGIEDDVSAIAVAAVPAGLIGARAYHVITDWRPIGVWLKVWEGGLGIPGGLIAGVAVGVLVARRRGMDLGHAMDALIPGIPVAQAIGRVGNWFNQEIVGGPSDLPWAVEIDQQHRPAEHLDQATFHPAFLYEGMWNLALAGFLVWVDRRGVLRKGMVLPLYVLGYGVGRFLVEAIRTDPATLILGVRINHWTSGIAVVGSILVLVAMSRRAGPSYYASEPVSPGEVDGSTTDDDASDSAGDSDGADDSNGAEISDRADDDQADDDDGADNDESEEPEPADR